MPATVARGVTLRAWLGWWIVGALFWLLLEDTLATAEDVDGAVAAALGATVAVAARRGRGTGTVAVRPARSWRPVVALVGDLPLLTRVLWRALRHGERGPGRIRTVPFAVDPDPDRRRAQIALASFAGSFAPATVVIAVSPDERSLLFHELVAAEGRRAADPLELG